MQFFRNLSIRAKLLGGVGVVLALTAVLGVVMIVQMGNVNAGGASLGKDALPSVATSKQISIDIADYRRAQLAALLDHVPATINLDLGTTKNDAAQISSLLTQYGSMVSNASDRQQWTAIKQHWADYVTKSAILNRLALDPNASITSVDTAEQNTRSDFADLQRKITTWANDNVAWGQEKVKSNASTYNSAKTIGIVLLALALILGLGIAFIISNQIRGRVLAILERLELIKEKGAVRIRKALEHLAEGDLTDEIHPTTQPLSGFAKDELGDVQRLVEETRTEMVTSLEAYNTAREQLEHMIGEVGQTAQTVSTSSIQMASTSEEAGRATGEIANAVGGIATGAERQVHAVEQARATADEVGRAVSEAAENAQRTAEVAHDARAAAQEGVAAAEEANAAMRSVRDSSAAVNDAIRELATKSEQIGKIVATITGIAEQTNLLALNAAIEAARAGEQGRGFAVVAEEVRKLAEESQSAAHEIAGLISAIQSETTTAVSVVEDGAARTEEGASVVERTREAFLRIGTSVDDMTARIEQIAAVSEQIAASAQSMQDHIGEVAVVAEQSSASTEEVSASTEETSASTEQIAASAQELSGNAETLNHLVARFRLTS